MRPACDGGFVPAQILLPKCANCMYQNSYRPQTRFSLFPPVIKNLLIINGLVFMAQLGPTGDFLEHWFALWPFNTPEAVMTPTGQVIYLGDFWPWQLVTYGFLHSTAGFGHILFNMFALWMFGMQLESTWGSKRFALYYFVCVIGAGLIQLLVVTTEGSIAATIGASGGVFGILLAFGMMFPNQPIYLYFLVPIKAKWVVLGYGVIELMAGVNVLFGAQSTVAHFAHLGGALFGFLMIMYWRGKLPIRPERPMYY